MKKHTGFRVLAALFFLATVFVSCEKLDVPKGTPACIKSKMRTYHKDSDYPLKVYKWEVGDDDYYLFGLQAPDFFAELYDDHCNYVCAPSGGLTGMGDGKCPVWNANPVVTLIWERE